MSDAAHAVGDRLARNADQVSDTLAPKVGEAARKVRDIKDDASDLAGLAGEIASTAVGQGRQILSEAKTHATSFADDRKNDAAQSISDLAASLRDAGSGFDDRPNIRSFVGSAADGLETLADGLRNRSFVEIYADAEDYARQRPVLVGAAALTAGFLLARFIKSTTDDLAASAARSAQSAHAKADRVAAEASSTAEKTVAAAKSAMARPSGASTSV